MFWDKKKETEKIKVYMFTLQRKLIFFEASPEPKEERQLFYYKELPYIVDLSAVQFFTEDKKAIFFYIEGIPNPVIFDLKKYIQKFIVAKRANPEKLVYDDSGNLLDLSFSSGALEQYKNNNFLKKLLAPMSKDEMKIIFTLLGVVALSIIANVIMLIIRR